MRKIAAALVAAFLFACAPALADQTIASRYDAIAEINASPATSVLHTRPATLSDLRKAEVGSIDSLHLASLRDWAYAYKDAHGPQFYCVYDRFAGCNSPNLVAGFREADPAWKSVVGTRWSFPLFAVVQTALHFGALAACNRAAVLCRIALIATGAGNALETQLGDQGQAINHAQTVAPYYGAKP